MNTQTILLFVIAFLLIWLVFLSYRLSQKNLFIETTLKKLSAIEKKGNMEELLNFIGELQSSGLYGSYFRDKLFSQKEALDFIHDSESSRVYIHYTREENDAARIMNDGFRFVESFHRTALHVTKDNLDLKMKHNERKLFGDFLVVISISEKIVHYYTGLLMAQNIRHCSFENILTEAPPVKNENSDLVFQLSPRYIKGYINYKTGKIISNPLFNPSFDSPLFVKNLEHIKGYAV
ncbi:MAG TPA: hypothetical protein VK213_07710 [Bacteroidales bacterium]|nr:hypothetical protein [Bacteroidales bacterium]